MVILVVNVLKGIQTQTAECLVISEITTKNLIIVLNKVDLLSENDREERIEACKKTIRSTLKSTKFADCPIISTAAAVGGERIAAINASASKRSGGGGKTTTEQPPCNLSNIDKEVLLDVGIASDVDSTAKGGVVVHGSGNVPNIGLDNLLTTITNTVELPNRLHEGNFFFSVDHCFPIKGQGTVITGTVLSGSVKVCGCCIASFFSSNLTNTTKPFKRLCDFFESSYYVHIIIFYLFIVIQTKPFPNEYIYIF